MATREQFLQQIGFVAKTGPPVDLAAKHAYEARKQAEKTENTRACTSFPASRFPSHSRACGRYLIYQLMNVPGIGDPDVFGLATMDAGKSVEEMIVRSWEHVGVLVIGKYDVQRRLELPEFWLSGFPDAVLDLRAYGWERAHPVEIKSKENEVIDRMKSGENLLDYEHAAQALAYAHMIICLFEELGLSEMGLKLPDGATVLYVSRSKPANQFQYFIEYDKTAVDEALRNLVFLKNCWKSGELPERDSSWMWTEKPCRYCEFKRDVCKLDERNGVTKIEDSAAVALATNVDNSWNLVAIRNRLKQRWQEEVLQ